MIKQDRRINEERYNNQGCLMKIIEYNNYHDIIVEFQDKYRARVHTSYQMFLIDNVKNPYYPSVCGVGISGDKYPIVKNNRPTREYSTWMGMLSRCFDEKFKNERPTYRDVICCEDWLEYEKFYEWLHSQENFDKWYDNNNWEVDKDILIKNNKIYSPDTCCLVPQNVNCLFIKRTNDRGSYPIGVTKHEDKFRARCDNPLLGVRKHIGVYSTPEEAFFAYKKYKENLIKRIADIEYAQGNITKQCYKAMINYKVEIMD